MHIFENNKEILLMVNISYHTYMRNISLFEKCNFNKNENAWWRFSWTKVFMIKIYFSSFFLYGLYTSIASSFIWVTGTWHVDVYVDINKNTSFVLVLCFSISVKGPSDLVWFNFVLSPYLQIFVVAYYIICNG